MPAFPFQLPPTPKSITAELLATTPEDVLENVLADYVASISQRPSQAALLPPALQAHYVAFVVDAEVLNGGFNQLFFNAPGVAEAAPHAFEQLGMAEAASLARSAWQRLESARPGLEAAREEGTMEAFMRSCDETPFGDLDDAYAAAQEDFRLARLQFIRDHAAEFLHPRRAGHGLGRE